MKKGYEKYVGFNPINIPDRTWPNNTITKAPVWCSVRSEERRVGTECRSGGWRER